LTRLGNDESLRGDADRATMKLYANAIDLLRGLEADARAADRERPEPTH
jgi:hypothetical protein